MSARSRPADLAPEARDDYTQILLYTLETWSEQQMESYSAALQQAFATIGANPGIGRSRDDLRPGLHSYPVERHIIFYRVEGAEPTVVRILHGRQDIARELRRS